MKHLHFIILLLITVLPVRSVTAQAVDMLVTSPILEIVPESSSHTVSLEFSMLTELGGHVLSSYEKALNFAQVRIMLTNLEGGANILPTGTGAELFSWSYVPAEKAYIGRSKDVILTDEEPYLVKLKSLSILNVDQSAKLGFTALLFPPQDLLSSDTEDDSLAFYQPIPFAAELTALRQNKATVLHTLLSPEVKIITRKLEVERSSNGKNWNKIGEIDPSIASDITKPLDFKDLLPKKGQNLYRLKMTDQNNNIRYSIERGVAFDHQEDEILYPNPVKADEKLNLLSSEVGQVTRIRIFDVTGNQVYQSEAVHQIDTSSLDTGSYLVQLSYVDGSTSTHRVVKQ